jgi:hypothetical protein
MLSKPGKQVLVWSVVLILVGVLLLIEVFTDLSPWIWILLLAAGGLGAFGLYLADRSDYGILITAYALWAIAILIVLVTLDVLRDDAVAFYVLIAIAIPFLVVFWRDRAQWWALIPAYVLSAVAVMIGLTGLGILDDALVPAYVLFAIAIPFFVVYARDRSQWWSLIPGGILAVIGLSFLVAEGAFAYIGAAVLIVVGLWFLVRAFTHKEPSPEVGPPDPDVPAATGLESDMPEEGREE